MILACVPACVALMFSDDKRINVMMVFLATPTLGRIVLIFMVDYFAGLELGEK